MKIKVVGIGQSLRGDDAVGLEAVRQWLEKYPETANYPDIEVDLMENPGMNLLDLLEGTRAIVFIDAVKSSATPGTIHHLDLEQLSSFTTDTKSAHGWGVAESLQLGRVVDPSKQDIPIRLIGIEGEQFQMGRGLSHAIEQILPRICEEIQIEVQNLLKR
jgi:hydrogenase maturation protease